MGEKYDALRSSLKYFQSGVVWVSGESGLDRGLIGAR